MRRLVVLCFILLQLSCSQKELLPEIVLDYNLNLSSEKKRIDYEIIFNNDSAENYYLILEEFLLIENLALMSKNLYSLNSKNEFDRESETNIQKIKKRTRYFYFRKGLHLPFRLERPIRISSGIKHNLNYQGFIDKSWYSDFNTLEEYFKSIDFICSYAQEEYDSIEYDEDYEEFIKNKATEVKGNVSYLDGKLIIEFDLQ